MINFVLKSVFLANNHMQIYLTFFVQKIKIKTVNKVFEKIAHIEWTIRKLSLPCNFVLLATIVEI